jgi:hypothetical protein
MWKFYEVLLRTIEVACIILSAVSISVNLVPGSKSETSFLYYPHYDFHINIEQSRTDRRTLVETILEIVAFAAALKVYHAFWHYRNFFHMVTKNFR